MTYAAATAAPVIGRTTRAIAGLRSKCTALVRMVGVKGLVRGSIALFLLVGLGAAATGVTLKWHLTSIGGDQAAIARFAKIYKDLQDVAHSLLIVVGTQGGESRLPAVWSSWRLVTADIAGLCNALGSPSADGRIEFAATCESFAAAAAVLDPLLRQDETVASAGLRAVVIPLSDLIDSMRVFEKQHHEIADQQDKLIGKLKFLLFVLAVATAGGLLSGLALTYLIGAAAATDRDRGLVAAQAEELKTSERRYRDLVDSLGDAVFTSNPEGRFTYTSAAATRLLGLMPEEFTNASVRSILHPDDHQRFSAMLRASRAAPHKIQSAILRCGASPETSRYLEVRFWPTSEVGANGRVGHTGIARDVHDQVLMERRQRDDTMKLRSIVESAGALILLVDRDLKVVLANHTFLAVTGDASRDVTGLPFEDVVTCGIDKTKLAAWLVHNGRERLAAIEFDNVLPTPDGGRRVVRVTASPVQDETGCVNYILFLGVDETARRSAEVQLLDAARLATVGQMATGIAHEINQPLTVIGFSVEALLEEMSENVDRDDPEAFRDALTTRLKRIDGQTQRAANIVRQLRIFARKPDETPGPFDVAQAISGAADLMSEQMRLARFDLEFDLTPNLPAVLGHPNRLQQVLINLFVNARDAVEEHRTRSNDATIQAWIGVRAYCEPGQDLISIEVADNGPGIPADVLPQLFEPFFTTKPSGKGTGLGLSISSEIVREMNGTITATNRPQGGALFRIILPIMTGAL